MYFKVSVGVAHYENTATANPGQPLYPLKLAFARHPPEVYTAGSPKSDVSLYEYVASQV